MRILIACECSGVVRRAFRADGWDMMIAHPPCDYLTNSAAWAFPDADFVKYPRCGYHQKVKPGTLTGADRRAARRAAVTFFLALWNCGIERICIENPTGHMNTHPAMKPARPQIVQPYQFGEDASKTTCLWLKGLPPLMPTILYPPRYVCQDCGNTLRNGWAGDDCSKCGYSNFLPRWSNQTDSGQNRLSPSDDRASVRAVTYSGIAAAMADQWAPGISQK